MNDNSVWTTEEDELLLSLRRQEEDSDLSWKRVADSVPGRSAESCRKRYGRLGVQEESGVYNIGLSLDEPVVDPLDILRDPIDWHERLEVAESVQRIRKADDFTVQIADRVIITDKPFGLWFTADWHLGSIGTDMKAWREHMKRFFSIDNLSMFLVGDMIANIATHRFVLPVFQQLLTPEEQGRVIGNVLLDLVLKEKLEAVVLTEEHDQRDARDTGVSFLREIVRPMRTKIPFLDNRGDVIFWIGPDKDNLIGYVIHACHKSRYNSFLNALHAANREARLSIPGNVIVTAHTHRPAMGVYNWFQETHDVLQHAKQSIVLGGEVFCVQLGTYERNAQYSRQQYGSLPEPKVQGLVFNPFERKIEMANSFNSLEKLLKV